MTCERILHLKDVPLDLPQNGSQLQLNPNTIFWLFLVKTVRVSFVPNTLLLHGGNTLDFLPTRNTKTTRFFSPRLCVVAMYVYVNLGPETRQKLLDFLPF